MRWLVVCAALVGAGVGGAAPGQCPAGCECPASDLLLYECYSGTLVVKGRDDGYMEVDCQYNRWNCSAMPRIANLGHAKLKRFEVTHCAAPATEAEGGWLCGVEAGGAGGTLELDLLKPQAALTARDLAGLNLTVLYLDAAKDVQTRIPIEAINSQPSLVEVRLFSLTGPPLLPGMFLSSPPLQYLELSASGVTHLPGDAFRGLSQLKVLSLWGNDIEKVDVDAFAGLSSLEQLWLDRNPLTTLPPFVFSPTPLLARLTLDRVRLSVLLDGTISGLQHLQELSISSEVPLSLSPRGLRALPALTSLSVPSSRVPALPPALLADAAALVNLTLAHNLLAHIPDRVFGDLHQLQMLDLSYNLIQAVSKETFAGLRALRTLALDGNRLRALPDRVFSGLSNLQSISLASNEISEISWAAMIGVESLRSLRLDHNRLAYSAHSWGEFSSPFNMLVGLQELSLRNNSISAVMSDWKFVLLALTALDLSYNNFTVLQVSELQFLQPSLEVDFSHNRISTVSPRAALTPFAPAARLRLDHNPYDCSCPLFFFLRDLQVHPQYRVAGARCAAPPALARRALRDVRLADVTCPVDNAPAPCACTMRPAALTVECDCGELPPGTALPVPAHYGLESMSLRLRSVPEDLRSLPEYVRKLNLTATRMEEAVDIPETVRVLDLTHNYIKRIPKELFGNNLTLWLAGNPLQCDCWTTSDVALLKNNLHFIADSEKVSCDPHRMLKVIDPESLCSVYRSSLAGLVFAAAGLLAGIVLAALYRYRVNIQVYLYSRRVCLCLLPREAADADKKYDVFVSFASEDEKFVCQEVLPRLEGRYVLHVQDRDWQVGDTIPTQIRHSIEMSRRTLLILSPNFLKSVWAGEELRMLHAQAAADKRRRAVVVLYEVQHLDRDMRTHLSLATQVRWNGSMFWEKVIYALPRNDMVETVSERYDVIGRYGGWGEDWKLHPLDVVVNGQGQLVNKGYGK